MIIPIEKAVKSSAWYYCQTRADFWDDDFTENKSFKYEYRIRVFSFEKSNQNEIDDPHRLPNHIRTGNLWILKVEVENLWKRTTSSFPVNESLILVDKSGLEFKPLSDHHLTHSSEYSRSLGLNWFNGSSGYDCGELIPRIPLRGALAFLIPDGSGQKYSLSVEGGNIRERPEPDKSEPISGWVYILANPSLPSNLLKIGMTARVPEERARELSAKTGVPTPYQLLYQERVSNCKRAEALIHRQLSRNRHRTNREFFDLKPEDAISVVKTVAAKFPITEEERVREEWEQRKWWESLLQLRSGSRMLAASAEQNQRRLEDSNGSGRVEVQEARREYGELPPKERLLKMIELGDGPPLHLKLRLHEMDEESIPSHIREEVWKRHGGKCVMCGTKGFDGHYDHVVSLTKGGASTTENIQLMCLDCIVKKLKKSDS